MNRISRISNIEAHTTLLLDEYRRRFGEELMARGPGEAERLMDAPFVVLSHGTEEDPVLNYGNRCAQALFEMDWDALTRMPSRFTAEPMHRDGRAKLLAEVRAKGFTDNYSGVRISSTGRRFHIHQAKIWMLKGAGGQMVGQAATFSDWSEL